MKILLTGASGFTGLHFTELARRAGHEVQALEADLTDAAALAAALQGSAPDFVVHLAAISFVGHAEAQAFYTVNTLGTLNLLDALAALPARPRRVLLASTAHVYGNAAASPIPESSAPAPINHYATSKLAMEHMARTYLDRLPIVITRPFNYTGPGQAAQFLIPKLVSHFARRAEMIELGNMAVEREFNDVGFVCAAYLQLLEKAAPGETYNICSGQPVSLMQVIESLSELTGHRIEVRVNPAFMRPNEIHRLCGDPSKLASVIDIPPPALRETLRRMLDAA